MDNLNNAINAVSHKEAVQFKNAIIDELSRRLYAALEDSRSSVANETFNNNQDLDLVTEDSEKDTEVEMTNGDDIQEKVDIDGRTSMYRSTVARIEQARKMRSERMKNSAKEIEEDNEKFDGLYDDGTGRGARIPKPLDINPNRFTHITKESVNVNEYNEAVMMKNGKYTMKEEELSPKQKEYRKFFDAALSKFKAKSPADLDDAKKKEFFNYVKQNWKG